MQEEVTQKTVTFCIRATKITADLLKKVLVGTGCDQWVL